VNSTRRPVPFPDSPAGYCMLLTTTYKWAVLLGQLFRSETDSTLRMLEGVIDLEPAKEPEAP
jgi:hypothetical protein